MSTYLFIVFISFIFNFVLIIPFINFLYKNKFQRAKQQTKDAFNQPTPIFDKFHQHKKGTPVGGGILLALTTVFLFFTHPIFIFLTISFMLYPILLQIVNIKINENIIYD